MRHEQWSRAFGAPIESWLAAPLPRDVKESIERLRRAPDARAVAVMPDVHLAGHVCIGVVLATRRLIYPQAVGADIGCGMAAMAFDGDAAALSREDAARRVLGALRNAVPILRHRSIAAAPPLPPDLAAPDALSTPALASMLRRDGRIELGTLGRGNHFLEFQSDEDGRLWVMVHSGSRAIGQAITAWHLQQADTSHSLDHLDAEAPEGRAYLADVQVARAYAAASRDLMLDAAARVVRAVTGVAPLEDSCFGTDHNHVQLEEHFGEPLWVHRKGAASAAEGERGIIPGSMASPSFHVLGRGCEAALRSSSHGAGRALTRTDARRAISARRLSDEAAAVRFDRRLAPRLTEEAPSAYKDITQVMRAQRDLVKIVRRLTPVLSYKGV